MNRRLITVLFHSTLKNNSEIAKAVKDFLSRGGTIAISQYILRTWCVLAGAESATDTAPMASDPEHFFPIRQPGRWMIWGFI